ncbi:DUF2924 domain-containing protein [Sphingomonas sp.]|jgi:hypothetical protein|uniref:DUF2924 domain-containing protein n=1 Tax=Sphingomonas sp. TaxID=28214 RepID=UPI002EDB8CA1
MHIDIDFEVYKALTALRQNEGHSYNDVLRDLLKLESIQEPEIESALQAAADILSRPIGLQGFFSRGVHLPDGTILRARYKQREYNARIRGDRWLDDQGREHNSPSAAAAAITGTNVNGLRFWEAKRPIDGGWKRLELLRAQ